MPGARRDPCRGHLRGRSQAPTCQGSTAVPTQQSTRQQGRHLRGDVQLPGQLSKHLRGGMQIFVKALPPHRLSSQLAWRCMPSQLGRASERDEAVTNETSFLAVPDKVRGHVGSTLNAFVLQCQAIDLYTVQTFHLLCATVATPLAIKGGPRHTGEGFRLFGPCMLCS